MPSSIIFKADAIRTIAFGSILATYEFIGSQFEQFMRMIYVTNTTDQLLMFSFNPTSATPDHFVVPAKASVIFDLTTNKSSESGWFVQLRTHMGVKHLGVAPTEGEVYVSAFFGADR